MTTDNKSENTDKALRETKQAKKNKIASWVVFLILTTLYLLFLYWVDSWWGLVVLPFLFDAYVTHKIKWGWWREPEVGPVTRFVMSWVDAIVFALVAIYFLNQFFFQNFKIPSSSLEKTLLTGDYLLVSKLSYGPRIPQTPLYMPLTQHTLPVFGCKSYLEHPHWEYRRVKGLGHVQLNDIVVFNYPAGDTVALNQQNQDYYRLAYQVGNQVVSTPQQSYDYTGQLVQQYVSYYGDSIKVGMPYAEQQSYYKHIYEAGTAYMRSHPEQFGEIVARPSDRRENYVKRCVGLPGQTLQIKSRMIYLDGKLQIEPENVQYSYKVTFKQDIPEEMKKELGISDEDLYTVRSGNDVWMPLTRKVYKELSARKDLVSHIALAEAEAEWLYPQNMAKTWTTADYGPIWIPKKGATLNLTLDNLPVYERPIRIYENNTLEVRDGKIFINGKETTSYTFRMDYYWMMGDNRDNSADSRFWGFVPEDHVVGKPLFVWLSLDPDYSLFNGGIRWNRFFKRVWDIK